MRVIGLGIALLVAGVLLALGFGRARAAPPPAAHAPGSYPSDPTADIAWTVGMAGVSDIQAAFNHARATENTQLGTSLPALTLPSQAAWNGMTSGQRAFWLINRERTDRGVMAMSGPEANVTSVAQSYAQYLMTNNLWGHMADGHDPWYRLNANPAIGACHDTLDVSENLAVFVSTAGSIPLPVEQSVYMWLYTDSSSGWGHRHMALWFPYNDNSGPPGKEGFLGIGTAAGGPYQGPFPSSWPTAVIVVMDVFDPCAAWNYNLYNVFLPVFGA